MSTARRDRDGPAEPAKLSTSVTEPAVKTRWHKLDDAIEASNLPTSDKAVYHVLLKRADYVTAVLAAKYTPMQDKIAKLASVSPSMLGYSMRHLERHGWLARFGRSGPKTPIGYKLSLGTDCDCSGRRHVADVSARGGASVTPRKPLTSSVGTVVADVTDVADSGGYQGAAFGTVPTVGTERCQPTVPTPQVNGAFTLRGKESRPQPRKAAGSGTLPRTSDTSATSDTPLRCAGCGRQIKPEPGQRATAAIMSAVGAVCQTCDTREVHAALFPDCPKPWHSPADHPRRAA